MNFLQRTPFFRLLLALMAGIVTSQYWVIFSYTQWGLLIISILLMGIAFLILKSSYAYKFRWIFGSGILLFLFLSGYHLAGMEAQKSKFPLSGKALIYFGKIIEAPLEKPNSWACQMQIENSFDSIKQLPVNKTAIVYFAKDSLAAKLKEGDRLLLRTHFQQPATAMNPNAFDYRKFLQRKGIGATAYVSAEAWQFIDHQDSFSLMHYAQRCRSYLLERYRDMQLPSNEMAVLSALTLGYKDELDAAIKEDFSHSGAMHILAVSGLHVGVIYLILQLIFAQLFKRSKTKGIATVFTICALWLYAFITGLPPSVIRASGMFSLVAIGAVLNRKSQIYNTIAVSAFFILLYNPNLLFDIGFQMSYMAVLSIVYFQPKISALVYVKQKGLKYFTDLLVVSVAAQIGTLPLSLYYFHQFPNYFLLTNIIVIPLASIIIYLAVLFLILSPIAGIAGIPAFILKKALALMTATVSFIHDLPFALSFIHFDFWQLTICALAIGSFCLYMEYRKFVALFTVLSFILLLSISHLFINIQSFSTQQLVVYSDSKSTHVDLINGHQHQLYTTDSIAANYQASSYWKSNKLKKPVYSNQSNSKFVDFKGQKILILTDSLTYKKSSEQMLDLDVLIIGNKLKFKATDILACLQTKLCVVDASISEWYTNDIQQYCETQGITFYDVKKEGAYINKKSNFAKIFSYSAH